MRVQVLHDSERRMATIWLHNSGCENAVFEEVWSKL